MNRPQSIDQSAPDVQYSSTHTSFKIGTNFENSSLTLHSGHCTHATTPIYLNVMSDHVLGKNMWPFEILIKEIYD